MWFWFLVSILPPHTPTVKGISPKSFLTSCHCGFLMWALIHRHLDKTATLFLHFNNSKGSDGQCTAVLKMYCTGLHLHLHLRWEAVSTTGLNSFKEVTGITLCPFIKTKNLVARLKIKVCFLKQGKKNKPPKPQNLSWNRPEKYYKCDKILFPLLLKEVTLIYHCLFYHLPFLPHTKTDTYGSILDSLSDSNLMTSTETCCWWWNRKKPKGPMLTFLDCLRVQLA